MQAFLPGALAIPPISSLKALHRLSEEGDAVRRDEPTERGQSRHKRVRARSALPRSASNRIFTQQGET